MTEVTGRTETTGTTGASRSGGSSGASGVVGRAERTELSGIGRLVRLAMRRDRIQLPVWIATITALNAVTVASVIGLYPTEADRVEAAVGFTASPVAVAFNGIVSGTSLGSLVMSQSLLVALIFAGLMSTLAVVRHSRRDEEAGRVELVRAAVVGRHAPLAAALLTVTAANAVLSVANAALLVACGLPLQGSLLAGAAIGAVGVAFGAVAAVAAQLTTTSRTANAIASATLGAAFLLRALGDADRRVTGGGTNMVSGAASWLSPIGWGQQTRPYGGDRWWPLALLAVLAVAVALLAFTLESHRDHGAALFAERRGPARASRHLTSPLGLAWRLHRSTFVIWAVGLGVLATAYGTMGNDVDSLVGDSQSLRDTLAEIGGHGTLAQIYISAVVGMIALAVAGFVVQVVLRARSEESSLLAEAVLATATSRTRWLGGHLAVAVLGAAALLLECGVLTGVAYAVAVGDGGELVPVLTATLVRLPAVLVIAGVVVLAVGWLGRGATAVGWAVLGLAVLVTWVGPVLDLPQLVVDVSPFVHVPELPAAPMTWLPVALLCAVAGGAVAAGLLGLRHRDISP